MRKIFVGSLPLVLVALLLMAPGATARPSFEFQDSEEEVTVIPLEKVLENPEAFRGITVSFVAQFHRLGQLDGTAYTKFEGDWWQNFSVWPDGRRLWVAEDYKNDFQYLFIRRVLDLAGTVAQAPIYSRWVITGTVSEVFRGIPWIDVVGFTPVETQMDKPSLVHLVNGFRQKEGGQFEAAAKSFHAAEHKGLPTSVRVLAMREEALALHMAGKTPLAVARLETALGTMPEDPASLEALGMCRAALGLDIDGHPLPGRTDVAVRSEWSEDQGRAEPTEQTTPPARTPVTTEPAPSKSDTSTEPTGVPKVTLQIVPPPPGTNPAPAPPPPAPGNGGEKKN